MFQDKVKQIMSSDVVSVGIGEPMPVALSLMAKNRISFIVVLSDEKRPVGVLTEYDIVRIMAEGTWSDCSVRDVMSDPVITIGMDDDIFSALHRLVMNNIRHLVVVDKSGYTAGILTLTDFLQRLGFEYFVDLKDASAIMTENVVTMGRDDRVKDALSLMARRRLGCSIIMEDRKPIGIFTERDVISICDKGTDPMDLTMSDVMSPLITVVRKETHILEVMQLMIKNRIRHLPVVDEDGRLLGIINQLDVTKGIELKYTNILRKFIEEQERKLREVNEQLEKKVKQRTNELFEANKRLKSEIAERRRADEELKESYEQIRNLALRIERVGEEERKRIARDIHDELGQVLTVLTFEISHILKKLDSGQKELKDKASEALSLVDNALDSVHRISSELRPAVLDNLGITAAIEWQAKEFENKTGIECEFSFEPEEIVLDENLSVEVFRIFQEALTNVARHSKATRVALLMKKDEDNLAMRITDNGRGIREEEISDVKATGVAGMRARVYPWDGTFEIKGIRGKGTTINVTVPLKMRKERGAL